MSGAAHFDVLSGTLKIDVSKVAPALQSVAPKIDQFSKNAAKSLEGFHGTIQRIGPALLRMSQQAQTAFRPIQAGASNAARALGALGIAAGAVSVKLISLASDANEAASKFGFVFGSATESTGKKLDEFSKAAGRSRYALRDMASNIGALIGPMGFTKQKTGELSIQFAKLATDLSSFFNVTESDALMALRSAIVGESEPMRRFGVQLNEAKIQAEAFRMGIARSKTEVQGAIKTQAIFSIVMRETKQAQGDAIRTGDQFANSLRRMNDFIKDAATDIGQAFIPSATAFVRAIGDMAEPIKKWAQANQQWMTQKVGQGMKFAADAAKDLYQTSVRAFQYLAPLLPRLWESGRNFVQSLTSLFARLPQGTQDVIKIVAALSGLSAVLTGIGGSLPLVGGFSLAIGRLISPLGALTGIVRFIVPLVKMILPYVGYLVTYLNPVTAGIAILTTAFAALALRTQEGRQRLQHIAELLWELGGKALKLVLAGVTEVARVFGADLKGFSLAGALDTASGMVNKLLEAFEALLEWFNGSGQHLESFALGFEKAWNSSIASVLRNLASLLPEGAAADALLAKADQIATRNAAIDARRGAIQAERDRAKQGAAAPAVAGEEASGPAGPMDRFASGELETDLNRSLNKAYMRAQTKGDRSGAGAHLQAMQRVRSDILQVHGFAAALEGEDREALLKHADDLQKEFDAMVAAAIRGNRKEFQKSATRAHGIHAKATRTASTRRRAAVRKRAENRGGDERAFHQNEGKVLGADMERGRLEFERANPALEAAGQAAVAKAEKAEEPPDINTIKGRRSIAAQAAQQGTSRLAALRAANQAAKAKEAADKLGALGDAADRAAKGAGDMGVAEAGAAKQADNLGASQKKLATETEGAAAATGKLIGAENNLTNTENNRAAQHGAGGAGGGSQGVAGGAPAGGGGGAFNPLWDAWQKMWESGNQAIAPFKGMLPKGAQQAINMANQWNNQMNTAMAPFNAAGNAMMGMFQQGQQALQQFQQVQEALSQNPLTNPIGFALQGGHEISDNLSQAIQSRDPAKIADALQKMRDYLTAQIQMTLQNVAFATGDYQSLSGFGIHAAGTDQAAIKAGLANNPQAAATLKLLQGILDKLDVIGKSLDGKPHMAAGGLVTHPTVALLGEAGPEVVIPLSQLGASSGGLAMPGVSGTPITAGINLPLTRAQSGMQPLQIPMNVLNQLFGNPMGMFPQNGFFRINPGGGSINPLGLNAGNLGAFGAMFRGAAGLLNRQADLGNLGALGLLSRWQNVQQNLEDAIGFARQRRQIDLGGVGSSPAGRTRFYAGSGSGGALSASYNPFGGGSGIGGGVNVEELHVHFNGVIDPSDKTQLRKVAETLLPAINDAVRYQGNDMKGLRPLNYKASGRGPLVPAGFIG